ncbi:TlpA disulfide reductase family protein [Sulfurimonas sp. C5]|uniref:TlpA family protein disulfide reductase n=1 Tax=Sulfurimonas sp. C5 TaxID=3036947 RepID=UPI00245853DA|nr:TlpA disulfide reductase family protein [Sulfurimonas sp. C5]MDH4944233.1 TlpA disulfide reductase family protein [Sulfurimonas sp. C5]
MLKKSILSLSVAIGLFFTACSKNDNDANALLSTNEFVLKEISGKEYVVTKLDNGFALKDQKEKIVILDIFATWCPPCQAEASHLTKLQEKYKDNLTVIGISVEDDINSTKLQKFRTEYNAQYPLAGSSENRRIINAVATTLNIGRNFGIPLMAMYKNGKLVNYYQGATEEEFIESDIQRALGK